MLLHVQLLLWCGKSSPPCVLSQSHAWTIQLRTRLATTRKGDQTTVVYYNKMKIFADEMAVVGKPLEDEDFISYVLVGLD
jgi:hypothetical protein